MRTRLFILITIVLMIASCSSWKTTLVSEGDVNDAIKNAIIDFMHTCNLRKKDSIFSAIIYIENDSIIGLSISGISENPIYSGPNPIKKVGTYFRVFPSQYQICDGKLFYWDDSTKQISQKIFDVLKQYNHVDSTDWYSLGVLIPPYIVNEYAKGAHYYFCRDNLMIYKRVVTHHGMGGYKPPKLNCNERKK